MLKPKRADLFKDMGLSTTDAIRLFLTQCVNQGGLPFQPVEKRPNSETLAALQATETAIKFLVTEQKLPERHSPDH